MVLDRQHNFEYEEALDRVRALTTYWHVKYGVQSRWNDATASVEGKVKGVKFKGNIRVEPKRIFADIKAGLLAEKLGGRKYVEDKLVEYLDPQISLESLKARAT